MTISIFGLASRRPTTILHPRSRPRPELAECAEPPWSPNDAELVAILDAALLPGESVLAGFARKETALGTAFAALDVCEARALHARLIACKAGDMLAEKFSRLVVDRRNRLLTFLAEVRRREARASGVQRSGGSR